MEAGGGGLFDLLAVTRIREKITAWGHGLIAVMLLSVASLNWLLRVNDGIGAQPASAFSLTLLTAVAAWLGGRLVYEHAVGITHRQPAAPGDDDA